jgi:chromosome segregation ATPase
VRRLLDVVRVSGPAQDAIRIILADAWIADDFDGGLEAAVRTGGPVATLQGEIFHGVSRIEGGMRAESRGILTTKREIKELRERAEEQRLSAERLRDDVAALDLLISATDSAILALQEEQHRQEKATVGFDLQAGTAHNAAEFNTQTGAYIANRAPHLG